MGCLHEVSVPRQVIFVCKLPSLAIQVVRTEECDGNYRSQATSDNEHNAQHIVLATDPRVCAQNHPLQIIKHCQVTSSKQQVPQHQATAALEVAEAQHKRVHSVIVASVTRGHMYGVGSIDAPLSLQFAVHL